MGLFGKKEKPSCAICGNKVSGWFPWKIEDQVVCNECHGQVDLSDEVMKTITIEEFKVYMAFREENALLKQKFQTTRKVDFGWFDDKFLFDANNRLLCMDKNLNKPVFEGRQVQSFEIKEDQTLLFSGSAEGLVRYTSTIPERVEAMAPQIDQIRVQLQIREDMKRMMDEMKDEMKENTSNSYNSGAYLLSSIDIPVPFSNFYVDIYFDHPYWPVFTADKKAPRFSGSNPDVNDYLNQYDKDVQQMEELARALMEVAFPGAPERTVAPDNAGAAGSGDASDSGAAADTVEELQRFKDLMDKGIITEEEFTAKKRQLLGI